MTDTKFNQTGLQALAETLFSSDASGRLSGGAPRLHILRAYEDLVVRCHADLPVDLAERLLALGGRPRGRPSQWSREYNDYFAELAKAGPAKAIRAGMIYCFAGNLQTKVGVTEISAKNAALLEDGLDEWLPDVAAGAPLFAVVVDGRAVSLCASVNMSTRFHCAGVETLPGFRGLGLASRAVAGWAAFVRASGAEPIYGTTFDNLSSQAIAQRLGLTAIASEFSIE